MAVSTATVMRTITSVTIIATTVTSPPKVDTSTLATGPFTVTQSVNEEPIAKPPQNDSSSSPTTMLSSTLSLPAESSSDVQSFVSSSSISTESSFSISTSSAFPSTPTTVSITSDPVFDQLPTPTLSTQTQDSSVSDNVPTSTSVITGPTTPVFDKSPVSSISSSVDSNTPQFIKQPSETQSDNENSQPVTTTDVIPSSQETSQQPPLEPTGQTTEDSSPVTTERSTSQSVEKAVIQPVPTGTGESASISTSSTSSSSSISTAPSTTLPISSTSTAASVPESTESSDSSTTEKGDSGITNPQSTITTATLPGGRITTIALDPTVASETSSPSESAVGVVGATSSNTPSTPVIVGSIVGSLAALSAILFLIFVLRRRMSKNRRSTLLTPLSVAPGASGSSARSEKRKQYEIDTASLGPTPRSAKLAAALAFYPKKFGKKLRLSQVPPVNNQNPTVNMNRGNSQFLDAAGSHSRHGSVNGTDGGRTKGWWSRMIQDTSSDDLLAQDMAERANHPVPAYFPGMDAEPHARENQQRRMSRPHSMSSWTSRASSPNPFSDMNAVNGDPTKPNYQTSTTLGNPFADSNSLAHPAAAQMAPASYIHDVQRSRGQTLSHSPRPRVRPESFDVVSFYRDSTATNSSFQTRRNKIHSNPFDLEIDGQPPMGPNMHPPRRPVPSSFYEVPRPDSTRTRGDSFTSRYTSETGWQGERSTRGPVSSRWDSTVGYVPIGHVRSESDSSLIVPPRVGQAM